MSQAEDLLDTLAEQASINAVTEEHIVINADRSVMVPELLKKIAVQFDHDIETVTFDCPRYWDTHDFSTMKAYINYMRADGHIASCPATNMVVDADDENMIHFDWTLSRNVTMVEGNISFLVCIKKTDTDGNEVRHWNSELNSDMRVSPGLESEDSPADIYPDIITALLVRMDEIDADILAQSISIEEIDNGHRVTWNRVGGGVVTFDVMNGDLGPTGAKIINTEYVGDDAQGGRVYEQTFDDGSKAQFTAPMRATMVEKSVEEAKQTGLNPFLKYKIYSDSSLQYPNKIAELPEKLSMFGVASVGKNVYIFGGKKADGSYTNAILKHDLTNGSVSTLPVTVSDEPRWSMEAVTIGTKIYLFGGMWFSSTSGEFYDASIRVFDTVTETISYDPNVLLPIGMTTHATAVVDNKVYIFGGQVAYGNSTSSTTNKIWVFDTETNTTIELGTKLPTVKAAMSAAAVGKKIYLFGGWNLNMYNTILEFNTETMDIQTLSVTLPDGRMLASAIARGTDIWLFGGAESTGRPCEFVYKYDTETGLGDIIERNDFFKNYTSNSIKAVYIPDYDTVYLYGAADRDNLDSPPKYIYNFKPYVIHESGLQLHINGYSIKQIVPEVDKYHPDYFTFQVIGYVYSEASKTAHIACEINDNRYEFLQTSVASSAVLEETLVARLVGLTKKIYMHDPDLTVEGFQGPKGDTPVKGVDYFTEEDKRELVDSVLDALPVAEGVEF